MGWTYTVRIFREQPVAGASGRSLNCPRELLLPALAIRRRVADDPTAGDAGRPAAVPGRDVGEERRCGTHDLRRVAGRVPSRASPWPGRFEGSNPWSPLRSRTPGWAGSTDCAIVRCGSNRKAPG